VPLEGFVAHRVEGVIALSPDTRIPGFGREREVRSEPASASQQVVVGRPETRRRPRGFRASQVQKRQTRRTKRRKVCAALGSSHARRRLRSRKQAMRQTSRRRFSSGLRLISIPITVLLTHVACPVRTKRRMLSTASAPVEFGLGSDRRQTGSSSRRRDRFSTAILFCSMRARRIPERKPHFYWNERTSGGASSCAAQTAPRSTPKPVGQSRPPRRDPACHRLFPRAVPIAFHGQGTEYRHCSQCSFVPCCCFTRNRAGRRLIIYSPSLTTWNTGNIDVTARFPASATGNILGTDREHTGHSHFR